MNNLKEIDRVYTPVIYSIMKLCLPLRQIESEVGILENNVLRSVLGPKGSKW